MYLNILLILFILSNISPGFSQNVQSSIIIENFNAESFGKWTKEGTAFGDGPCGGYESHHMVGFLGSGFASSVNIENEPATGTIAEMTIIRPGGMLSVLT